MANNSITISRVETKRDWKDFYSLPWKIYEGNPYWTPPLLMQVKEILDEEKYPFWQHARKEVFLARRKGETIGRIIAVVDDNHNKFHEEKMGFFGFFECLDDQEAANALFDEAKNWCSSKGMTCLRGPASPSLNEECAFLLEGFNLKPAVMMPYTHEYYLKLAETYGFRKSKDLIAFLKKDTWGIPERFIKMIERMKKNMKIHIRSLNMKNYDKEIEILMNIYNSAWEKNWGFVPMTDDEMLYMGKTMRAFVDPELVKIAEVDGEPVGIAITIPNLNEVLEKLNGKMGPVGLLKFLYNKNKIKGTRTIAGGTRKDFRNTGIIAALFYETEISAKKNNYSWCELGWNLEDNALINDFDMAIGGKIYKKYRIYEMPIQP